MQVGAFRRIVSSFAAQSMGMVGLLLERFGLAALFIGAFGLAGYEGWLETAAWCGLFSGFSFGLNYWSANSIQQAGSDPFRSRHAVRLAITAGLATISMAAAAAVAVASLTPLGPGSAQGTVAVWLTVVVCGKMAEAFLIGALRGLGRLALGLWIAVGGQFVMLALTIVLVLLGQTMSTVAAGQAAVGAATQVALSAALLRVSGYGRIGLLPAFPSRGDVRDLIHRGLPYAVPTFANIANVHMATLIVAAVDGVAGFVLIRTLTGFSRQIVQQFAYSIIDEIARSLAGPTLDGARRALRDAIRWACVVSGLIAGWLIWVATPVVELLSQGRVVVDELLVWVLAAALPVTAPGLLFGTLCLFVNKGGALAVSQSMFIAVLAVLVAVPDVAAWGGAVGVGATLVGAEFAASVCLLGRIVDRSWALGALGAACIGIASGLMALALSWVVGAVTATLVSPAGLTGMAAFTALWSTLCLPVAAVAFLRAAERRWMARKVAVAGIGGRNGNL